jgi:hypothetical protein
VMCNKQPLRTRQNHVDKDFQSPLMPKVCGCYLDDCSSFRFMLIIFQL